MLEVLFADYRKKFFVEPGEDTTVGQLKHALGVKVNAPAIEDLIVIDLESMNVLDEDFVIGEVTRSINSRILVV